MPDRKYPKPNLDLIRSVQAARRAYDANARPSEIPGNYWIEAIPSVPTNTPTARCGRWAITTTVDEVDAFWGRIKQATESGKLGYKSKVSTASRDVKNPLLRLITVCTYDADDAVDMERVRAALRELGVEGALTYEHER